MESFTNAHIVVLGKALLCAEQRAKMTSIVIIITINKITLERSF